MVASMAKMHPQTRLVLWDVARYVVSDVAGQTVGCAFQTTEE